MVDAEGSSRKIHALTKRSNVLGKRNIMCDMHVYPPINGTLCVRVFMYLYTCQNEIPALP